MIKIFSIRIFFIRIITRNFYIVSYKLILLFSLTTYYIILRTLEDNRFYLFYELNQSHCVKSVHIRSYSSPYSVWIRENTDQNSSEYGHFLRSVSFTDKQIHWELVFDIFLLYKCVLIFPLQDFILVFRYFSLYTDSLSNFGLMLLLIFRQISLYFSNNSSSFIKKTYI